jgi:hypothetical protein
MAVDTATSIDPNRYALQQAQQARQLAAEQAAAAKTKMQDSPAVPYRAQAPAGATPDLLASKFVIRPATPPGREVPVLGQGSSPPSSHPAPKPGDPGFIGPVAPQAMAPPDERPAPGALEPFRLVPSSIAAPDRTGLGGAVVLRVHIDPRTFPDWCAAQGMRPGGAARKKFVAAAVTGPSGARSRGRSARWPLRPRSVSVAAGFVFV